MPKKHKKEDGKKRSSMMTPTFVANFAGGLLKAKAVGDSEPFYSVMCALPKKDPFWAKLEKALNAALKEKFGKVPKKMRDWPIKDGNEMEDESFHGKNFIRPKTFDRPGIVDHPDCEEILDTSEIYSGMKCRATIRPHAWEYAATNSRGVSIYLDNVQKMADGKRISGRPSAADDFADAVDDDFEDEEEELDTEDEEEEEEDDILG